MSLFDEPTFQAAFPFTFASRLDTFISDTLVLSEHIGAPSEFAINDYNLGHVLCVGVGRDRRWAEKHVKPLQWEIPEPVWERLNSPDKFLSKQTALEIVAMGRKLAKIWGWRAKVQEHRASFDELAELVCNADNYTWESP